jgi:hypothetical protein
MEIEERLKILEGEMKILKNEIQSALLDIQEQILSHYYPVLRAEEIAPPASVKESYEGIRTEQKRRDAAKESREEEAPTRPKTKKVSLDEIRAKATVVEEEPFPLEEIGAEAAAEEERETDPGIVVELAAWLNDSVEKIGGDRISRLIDGYAAEEFITSDVEDILTGLIALNGDGEPPGEVKMTDTLDVILKLNKILKVKKADVALALSFIEEE